MPIRILIVFDSVYGNTEKIARVMGDALSRKCGVIDRCSIPACLPYNI